jgi:hypothetical protein
MDLALIPWRLVGSVALVAGVVFGVWHYGETRYEAGRTEMKAEVDRVTEAANQRERASELAHMEHVNAVSAKYEAQAEITSAALAAARAQLADAAAAGGELRSTLHAIAAVRPGPSGQAAGRLDGAAQVLGELLDSCSSLAERNQGVATASAAEAERLADRVRGLQSYALEVSGK